MPGSYGDAHEAAGKDSPTTMGLDVFIESDGGELGDGFDSCAAADPW